MTFYLATDGGPVDVLTAPAGHPAHREPLLRFAIERIINSENDDPLWDRDRKSPVYNAIVWQESAAPRRRSATGCG